MKACIDCKHITTLPPDRPAVCGRFAKPVEHAYDVVWGTQSHFSAPDCKDARAERGQCGPKGRSWERRYGAQPEREFASEMKKEVEAMAAEMERVIATDIPPFEQRPWWKRWTLW